MMEWRLGKNVNKKMDSSGLQCGVVNSRGNYSVDSDGCVVY